MSGGVPTLQQEADIARRYYLYSIYSSLNAHATIRDGEAKMFQQGNGAWFLQYPEYYDQRLLEDSFYPTPRGQRHSSFHLMLGTAHTPRGEQINIMAEGISSRIGFQNLNFTLIDSLNRSNIRYTDKFLEVAHIEKFKKEFHIKYSSPLNSVANKNPCEVIFKAFYLLSDFKEKYGRTPHEISSPDIMNWPLESIRPAEMMFYTGILDFNNKGIAPNEKALGPDTNLKALEIAVHAVNKLSVGANIEL